MQIRINSKPVLSPSKYLQMFFRSLRKMSHGRGRSDFRSPKPGRFQGRFIRFVMFDVRGFRTLWKKSLLTHTSSVFSAHASSLLLLLSTSSLQENHSRSRRTPACPPASLLLRLFWKYGASHREPAASQPAQSAPNAAAGRPRGSLSRLDAQMDGR